MVDVPAMPGSLFGCLSCLFARQRAHWESGTLASTQTIEQSAIPAQVDVCLRRNIRVQRSLLKLNTASGVARYAAEEFLRS